MTMTMRAEAALDQSPLGHELPPAVSATEVTRRYGRDDSAVDALQCFDRRCQSIQFHGRDGPVGLW